MTSHQDVIFFKSRWQAFKNCKHVIAPTCWQVGCYTTRANEVVIHSKARDLLEETKNIFTFTPSVQHHGHCAEVHSVSGEEQQMAAHTIQFGQQHAHPHGTFRYITINAKQLFHCHRENKFVIQWRQIIHASDVGAALHERE